MTRAPSQVLYRIQLLGSTYLVYRRPTPDVEKRLKYVGKSVTIPIASLWVLLPVVT